MINKTFKAFALASFLAMTTTTLSTPVKAKFLPNRHVRGTTIDTAHRSATSTNKGNIKPNTETTTTITTTTNNRKLGHNMNMMMMMSSSSTFSFPKTFHITPNNNPRSSQFILTPPPQQPSLPLVPPPPLPPRQNIAMVFTQTNSPNDIRGNEIIVYLHKSGNSLDIIGRFPTGGKGTGGPFGSQDAMIVHNGMLLSVNSGTNDISVFEIKPEIGLIRKDIEPSRGISPNSIAAHGSLVYVLNQLDVGSFSGYRLDRSGDLEYLNGSTRSLADFTFGPQTELFSAHINPSQIGFTPDGKYLIVVIKGDSPEGAPGFFGNATFGGSILSYAIHPITGLPSVDPVSIQRYNNNERPFSFNMIQTTITVSAIRGTRGRKQQEIQTIMLLTFADARGTQSIRIRNDGSFEPLQDIQSNGNQAGLCWNSNNGRFVFAANTGAGTLSTYKLNADGTQSLLNAVGHDFGGPFVALPFDLVYRGDFLYSVQSGSGSVAAFYINNDDGAIVLVDEKVGVAGSRSVGEEDGVPFFNGNPLSGGITAYAL